MFSFGILLSRIFISLLLLPGLFISMVGSLNVAAYAESENLPPQTLTPSSSANAPISLAEALRLAEENNLELKAARLNLPVGEADIRIARRIPNPELIGAFSAGSMLTKNSDTQLVGLNQLIETAGKRHKRTDVARAQFEQTKLEFDFLRWDIRNQVRQSYVELLASQNMLKNLEVQTFLLDQLVTIAQKRYQAGAASGEELQQALLARKRIEASKNETIRQVEQAKLQLNSLMGNPLPSDYEIKEQGYLRARIEHTEIAPPAERTLPDKEELIQQALQARLDLKAAEQQRKTSELELKLAKAQRIPDVELSAGFAFAPAPKDDPDYRLYTGPFVQFTVPLPVRHNQGEEIAQAQWTIQQNRLRIRELERQIRLEADTAYAALKAAQKNIELYEVELLPAAQRVLSLARRAYEVGKSPLANVILAQQSTQELLEEYYQAIAAYHTTWSQLERAVGQPLETP